MLHLTLFNACERPLGSTTVPARCARYVLASLLAAFAAAHSSADEALKTWVISPANGAFESSFDARVESLRQPMLSTQVPGRVTEVLVQSGQQVQAGQVLLRIDRLAADQAAAAADAQVSAARAQWVLAQQDLERQRQLHARQFISDAALERAQATQRAAQAQMDAIRASAGATRAQSQWYEIKAPFAGMVHKVMVDPGDMATPGRPLLAFHDPQAFRVSAHIPVDYLQNWPAPRLARVQIQGLASSSLSALPVRVLPAADAGTHTAEVQIDLPLKSQGMWPGQFARIWLSTPARAGSGSAGTQGPASADGTPLRIPRSALIRRGEIYAVYVLGTDSRPMLRQVRPGRTAGDQIEIQAGLRAGERLVLEPLKAAVTAR